MASAGSQVRAERIGLMGGTFDPIHYGHLVAAEAARVDFGLDRVVFIPSGHPPHKTDKTISSGWDRYTMTMLAVSDNPHFDVSDTEIKREGLSFAIDTVREFRASVPEDVEIYFITGADACLEILGWKDSCQLLSECRFIAATRPGISDSYLKEEIARLYPDFSDRFYVLEVPALAISSTDIRLRVKDGRSIRYLLPESVRQYISRRGLYISG
jgi:nicotinate-nucleotide adenylyltransferase